MSYTNTTELNLRKDGVDETIAGFRGVVNDNLDLIDAAYAQSLENIAAIEGSTASAAHSVGTYLVQNGTLYRVTSAIAIGDTITPGTNVIATDLNTAVTSLNTAASNLTSSLAAVEQTTATANHAIGDYFMLGNVLMQATAAIATGEQISVSNATPATLQSQINSLRDSVDSLNTSISAGYYEGDMNFDVSSLRIGLYNNNTSNKPPNSYGGFISIGHTQFAFGGTDYKSYVRRANSSNIWGSWVEVWHSVNNMLPTDGKAVPFLWLNDVKIDPHSTAGHTWRIRITFSDGVSRAFVVGDSNIYYYKYENDTYTELWSKWYSVSFEGAANKVVFGYNYTNTTKNLYIRAISDQSNGMQLVVAPTIVKLERLNNGTWETPFWYMPNLTQRVFKTTDFITLTNNWEITSSVQDNIIIRGYNVRTNIQVKNKVALTAFSEIKLGDLTNTCTSNMEAFQACVAGAEGTLYFREGSAMFMPFRNRPVGDNLWLRGSMSVYWYRDIEPLFIVELRL